MMKTTQRFGLLLTLLIVIISCKSEEEKQAEITIAEYERFVDSLNQVTMDEAEPNLAKMEAEFELKSEEAEKAMEEFSDQERAKKVEKLKKAKSKYVKYSETVKKNIIKSSLSPLQALRNSLFGIGKVNENRNFTWVTSTTILSVYEQVFEVYKDHNHEYSKEEIDEIKLLMKGLNQRRSEIEKDIPSKENNRIGMIKFKMNAKLRIDRLSARSEEKKN